MNRRGMGKVAWNLNCVCAQRLHCPHCMYCFSSIVSRALSQPWRTYKFYLMYYVPYILTEATTMYLTVPLHYAFIAFSHAQRVSVPVCLMITEVALAKTMQCLMRNALRRSICRSGIGQRDFQICARCLHCPYALRRWRKEDGKPLTWQTWQ